MKKLIASTAAVLMLASGASAAVAAKGQNNGKAGPNGNNNHGLCTAYFNGSETGRANKRQAGPFVALEQAARDGGYQNEDGETIEHAVMEFCQANSGGKGIGGNPTLPES